MYGSAGRGPIDARWYARGGGRECEFGKEQRLLAASDWPACVAGQGGRRRGDTDCLTWTRRDTDSIDDVGVCDSYYYYRLGQHSRPIGARGMTDMRKRGGSGGAYKSVI